MISTKLKSYLDNAGVAYVCHPHPPACTSQEIAQCAHIPGREMVKSSHVKSGRNVAHHDCSFRE